MNLTVLNFNGVFSVDDVKLLAARDALFGSMNALFVSQREKLLRLCFFHYFVYLQIPRN